MLQDVPRLITVSSHSGFKRSLLEVNKGLPSVSSNCQTWALPTVTYLEQSFSNPRTIPGWFSSPSSILLPSLCFCLSGPVPISKPWGVDSSNTQPLGFTCMSRLLCPSVSLFQGAEEAVALLCCTGERPLTRSTSSVLLIPPPPLILVHGKAQTRLWMDPFILRKRVDKVNLSLSGWGSFESYCHCWCNTSWNFQTSYQTLQGPYGDINGGKVSWKP